MAVALASPPAAIFWTRLSVGIVIRLTSVTVGGYFRASLVSLSSVMMAAVILLLRIGAGALDDAEPLRHPGSGGAVTYAGALLILYRNEVRTLVSIVRAWRSAVGIHS